MKWEASSTYSHDDLHSMQQDAIQRVREMQHKADIALQTAQRNPSFYANPSPRPSSSASASSASSSKNSQKKPEPKPKPESFPQIQREDVENFAPILQNQANQTNQTNSENISNFSSQISSQKSSTQPDSAMNAIPFAAPISAAIDSGKGTIHKVMAALNLDNERLLILLLLFLLYNDGADYTLLFALLYLFL